MDKEGLLTHLKTKKELNHRDAESKDELKCLFQRVCTNALPAKDANRPKSYRRTDLSQWAEEAFDKGDLYFHVKPVNPEDPYGELRLCEPEYAYKLTRNLSEKEFAMLFND